MKTYYNFLLISNLLFFNFYIVASYKKSSSIDIVKRDENSKSNHNLETPANTPANDTINNGFSLNDSIISVLAQYKAASSTILYKLPTSPRKTQVNKYSPNQEQFDFLKYRNELKRKAKKSAELDNQ